MWSALIIFSSVCIGAQPQGALPLFVENQPVGLIFEEQWTEEAEASLTYVNFTDPITHALPTTDGRVVLVNNGQAHLSTPLGCQQSPLDVPGLITELHPDTLGYAWLMLVKNGDDWFVYQSSNSGQSWNPVRQFSAFHATLATTEMGWAVLKQTEVGWTLEQSSATGGAPTTNSIELQGRLDLLDATAEKALIRQEILSTEPLHGTQPELIHRLHVFDDTGLLQLSERTDGGYWTAGVVDHNHGVYTLDSDGLVINHINGFEVEQGQADCLWKANSYESLWLCRSSTDNDELYRLWQSNDGIQWVGWFDQTATEGSCASSNDPVDAQQSKGCMIQQSTPFLFWVAMVLGLTRRKSSDT